MRKSFRRSNAIRRRRARQTGIHLWLVLWKAFEALQAHAYRNIRSVGLGLSDFAVLELLLHKGPNPVNSIGARVGLTSGSATVAIDRLERRRLTVRKNDPRDRRARVVHLTPRGRRLIEKAFTRHAKAMERVVGGLSKRECSLAARLLKKLGKHAAALP